MILPQNRLIFWAGVLVLPFASLGCLLPSARLISAVVICLFFFVALADAALARKSFEGIGVEFPDVLRMRKNLDGKIEFFVTNEKAKPKRLLLGLAFPGGIYSAREDLLLQLPAEVRRLRFDWPCRALRRGRYMFHNSYLECPSLLGLWAVRKTIPSRFEVRVYPDLSGERKNIAASFLKGGNFGMHSRRHAGTGRDFEKLREYIHGDSYDHIHWKATAKRGCPVTKVFQVERTQEVYLIIDASRLSSRPSAVPPADAGTADREPDAVLERFITSALITGAAAERQGDLFGIITFSDRVLKFIRAGSGMGHYRGCCEALYTLQPEIVAPDFDELCSFIGLKLRRRALLIFLTSLDDPALAESFAQNIELIRRKHLVMVNMLNPGPVQPLFSGLVRSADDIYLGLAGHIVWHNLLGLERVLRRRGVGFFLLNNERICADMVSQYMDVKQRQLL